MESDGHPNVLVLQSIFLCMRNLWKLHNLTDKMVSVEGEAVDRVGKDLHATKLSPYWSSSSPRFPGMLLSRLNSKTSAPAEEPCSIF